MDMIEQQAELIRRVKQQAQLFVLDNMRYPTAADILIIESAMMVGAGIASLMELETLC